MQLLSFRDRTEKELRDRLRSDGFADEGIEAAVSYVSSFGYLDDRRYAENFVIRETERKSTAVIRRELRDKGVDSQWIDAALEETPPDENRVICRLLEKKCGAPHRMDEGELRRTYAYFARRGFSASQVRKALDSFQESAIDKLFESV